MVRHRSSYFIAILIAIISASTINVAAIGMFDTSTQIFHPSFHTLQSKVNGSDQLPPVIVLGSDDRLSISFDEIADERRYMRYELIHCNMRWQPDGLIAQEFLNGFNEGAIEDYRYSEATLAHYVHYELQIPNNEIDPLVSGNYLLRVYDESEPETTLLQSRFCIVEPMTKVYAEATSRTDIDYNDSHQQITVTVDTDGANVLNVFTDLAIAVSQNSRIDNIAVVNTPSRISGKEVHYEHCPTLIFPAGNEYRRMEIVSTTYPSMGVAEIVYAEPLYHATLFTDRPRANQSYSYDSTQHGRFRIRQYESDDSDTEADYIMTHFSLEIPEQTNVDIFLDGDFVQRRFSPESRMVFNRATGLYEHSILLKQGAYNYQYLAVPYGKTIGSTSLIEGDHYQTINEYLILVYLRRPGERYDRLVGITSTLSGL